MTAEIRPFRLAVPQTELDDLTERLARTRWPQQPSGIGWERGVPLDYLQHLAAYWRTAYDWRTHEARLNTFPQFITQIDGQAIHFVHVRSSEPDALPLLLLHGYPGSVVDFLEVFEPLSNPRAHGGNSADAFHVVAISLPGLGLAPAVTDSGWNLLRTTQAVAELMPRLGYQRYAVQAGDAGAGVAGLLGAMYHANVLGVHLNGPEPFPEATPDELAALEQSAELTAQERLRLQRMQRFDREGSGYIAIQSTRPSTIGYGLHDCPVLQLAWIAEKYKEWTDPAKQLPEDAIPIDQLLTNVSVYWFTGNGAGAAQFLYENLYPAEQENEWAAAAGGAGDTAATGDAAWSTGADATQPAPTGVAVFAADNTIRALVDRQGTIEHWSEFTSGGHFPAMEVPELFVGDVRTFFRRVRQPGAPRTP